MICTRTKSVFIALPSLLMLAACAATAPSQPAKLVPFPGTPTLACAREEILPKITETLPAKVTPGSEVTVIASGGYFRDSCGAYDESSRVYQIYMDDEPVADLLCYVNHCEGKFVLSQSTTPGVYCMGVVKGTCQVKFEVTGE